MDIDIEKMGMAGKSKGKIWEKKMVETGILNITINRKLENKG